MKPCWRRWATSRGCFSLLSVALSPPLVCPQTAVAVCSFAWPFLEKKLAWLHCRVRAPCTPICGGTELSLCANDPCQAQGSRACCGARKGNLADANEVHVHSVSVCAESCTCDNIHPLEYKMSDFRETRMVTNENEKWDDLFSFLWLLSAGWIASLRRLIICRLSYCCICREICLIPVALLLQPKKDIEDNTACLLVV